jgi:hypothetical protein
MYERSTCNIIFRKYTGNMHVRMTQNVAGHFLWWPRRHFGAKYKILSQINGTLGDDVNDRKPVILCRYHSCISDIGYLLSSRFLSCFPTKTLYAFLSLPPLFSMRATCPPPPESKSSWPNAYDNEKQFNWTHYSEIVATTEPWRCRLCPWKRVKTPGRVAPDKHRSTSTVAGKNMASRGLCLTLLGFTLVCWSENIQVRDLINMVTKCNFQLIFEHITEQKSAFIENIYRHKLQTTYAIRWTIVTRLGAGRS